MRLIALLAFFPLPVLAASPQCESEFEAAGHSRYFGAVVPQVGVFGRMSRAPQIRASSAIELGEALREQVPVGKRLGVLRQHQLGPLEFYEAAVLLSALPAKDRAVGIAMLEFTDEVPEFGFVLRLLAVDKTGTVGQLLMNRDVEFDSVDLFEVLNQIAARPTLLDGMESGVWLTTLFVDHRAAKARFRFDLQPSKKKTGLIISVSMGEGPSVELVLKNGPQLGAVLETWRESIASLEQLPTTGIAEVMPEATLSSQPKLGMSETEFESLLRIVKPLKWVVALATLEIVEDHGDRAVCAAVQALDRVRHSERVVRALFLRARYGPAYERSDPMFAAQALVDRINEPAAREALIELVRHTGMRRSVSTVVLPAVGRLEDPRVVPYLIRLARFSRWEGPGVDAVRVLATRLGEPGVREGLEKVLRRRGYNRDEVIAAAAEALSRAGE